MLEALVEELGKLEGWTLEHALLHETPDGPQLGLGFSNGVTAVVVLLEGPVSFAGPCPVGQLVGADRDPVDRLSEYRNYASWREAMRAEDGAPKPSADPALLARIDQQFLEASLAAVAPEP